jgi:MoaA/NifB/PqqE/SkfB family radical SAM enzyme
MSNCNGAEEMTAETWSRIFDEAIELGISFILLAGGEPLLRRDVIEAAAKRKSILFPVFTNGIKLDESVLQQFNNHRNLVPVISIEGDENVTDSRRGEGVYKQVLKVMKQLKERGILYGVSVTVTSENLEAVTNDTFIDELEQSGCKLVLFVEYVPVEQPDLALQIEKQTRLAARVNELRKNREEMIIISFPGDEADSGGCMAAGRGFFHINATGDAEPCPFSPYSDLNLRNTPLIDALDSNLFNRLRSDGILSTTHTGGCVLFEQEERVKQIIEEKL